MGQTKQNYRYLRCFSWNADGIKEQFEETMHYLQINKIDVALINETHLKNHIAINNNRYQFIRYDRNEALKGGLLIAIRKNIAVNPVTLPRLDSIEALACSINLHNSEIIFIVTYKKPETQLNVEDLQKLQHLGRKILIAGDLNSKHRFWNSRKQNRNGLRLYDSLHHIDFAIIAPTSPTHYPKNGGTPDVLDVVLYKNVRIMTDVLTDNVLNSDHLPIIFEIDSQLFTSNTTDFTEKLYNWDIYKKSLHSVIQIPRHLSSKEEIDNAILIITDQIKLASKCSSFILPLPVKCKDDLNLHYMILLKNYVRRKYQSTKHPSFKRLLNKFKVCIHKRILRQKLQKWNTYLHENDRPQQKFWNVVKKLKNPHQKMNVPLKEKGRYLCNPQDKANSFANCMELQFQPNIPNYSIDFIQRINNFKVQEDFNIKLPTTFLTTPKEISTIISKLPLRRATGADGITNAELKHLPRKAIVAICKIINRSFQLHYFPESWKKAIVIMLRKPGLDDTIPTSYRPISLLSNLSKIWERVLLKRLSQFTEEHNILPDEQFGFRVGLGTELQLLRVTDYLTSNAAAKNTTLGLFLDAAKAYDKIWHQGLIFKMTVFKFPSYIIETVRSFLTLRTFQIKVEGKLSMVKPILAGVPQGAVLSPLLFNIYVADIPKINNALLSLFADDVAIFSCNKNPRYAFCQLQRYADLIAKWTNKWRIEINTKKSAFVPFTWKRTSNLPSLLYNNNPIELKSQVKYLGIIFDKKLLFEKHVEDLCLKMLRKYIILYPLLKSVVFSVKTKLLIYKMIIRSSVDYAGGVWQHAAKTHKRKLQVIQNKILRTLTGFSKDTRISQIHEDLDIDLINTFLRTKNKKLWARLKNHQFPIFQQVANTPLQRATWRTPR